MLSFVKLSTWSSCLLSNSKSAVTSFSNCRSVRDKKSNYATWSLSVACKTGLTCPSMGISVNASATYTRSIKRSLVSFSRVSMRAFIGWSRASYATWRASSPTSCTQTVCLGAACRRLSSLRRRPRPPHVSSSRYFSKRLQPILASRLLSLNCLTKVQRKTT